jgi:hypothetical protein
VIIQTIVPRICPPTRDPTSDREKRNLPTHTEIIPDNPSKLVSCIFG